MFQPLLAVPKTSSYQNFVFKIDALELGNFSHQVIFKL